MKFQILQKYIFKDYLRYLVFSCVTLSSIFITFDFFDRIDVVLRNDPSFLSVIFYFAYKVPSFMVLTLPVATVIACLLTIGLLSKNSELTAMRACGLKVFWLCKPIVIFSLFLSFFNIFLNETVAPFTNRRSKEIYNIDIQKKDKKGTFNQENIWWRDKNFFYTSELFDSRDNRLLLFSQFNLNSQFELTQRTDATIVKWLGDGLGWSMQQPKAYRFEKNSDFKSQKYDSLPLPLNKKPKEFYRAETDPDSMNYFELNNLIKNSEANGLSVSRLTADLYAKLSAPLVIFVCSLIVIPLALRPARSGSLASSFIASLALCFSYYAVHSLSLAFARADFWPPLLAAWMANIILLVIGILFVFSVEEPE